MATRKTLIAAALVFCACASAHAQSTNPNNLFGTGFLGGSAGSTQPRQTSQVAATPTFQHRPMQIVVTENEKRTAINCVEKAREVLVTRDRELSAISEEFAKIKKRLDEKPKWSDVASGLTVLSKQAGISAKACGELLEIIKKIEDGTLIEDDNLIIYGDNLVTLSTYCANKAAAETDPRQKEDYEYLQKIYDYRLGVAASRVSKSIARNESFAAKKSSLLKIQVHMTDMEELLRAGAASIERDSVEMQKLYEQVMHSTVLVNENLKTLADVVEKGIDKEGLKEITKGAPIAKK